MPYAESHRKEKERIRALKRKEAGYFYSYYQNVSRYRHVKIVKDKSLWNKKEYNPFYGKKHTSETILKMSNSHKKENLNNLSTEKMSSTRRRLFSEGKLIYKVNTSIELKIQSFLKNLGVEFYTHCYIKDITHKYQCDIFIPAQDKVKQKTIIECDGDFIHCNPKIYVADYVRFPNSRDKIKAKQIWARDETRTEELINQGFRVIRIWGSDIKKMTLEGFEMNLYGTEGGSYNKHGNVRE